MAPQCWVLISPETASFMESERRRFRGNLRAASLSRTFQGPSAFGLEKWRPRLPTDLSKKSRACTKSDEKKRGSVVGSFSWISVRAQFAISGDGFWEALAPSRRVLVASASLQRTRKKVRTGKSCVCVSECVGARPAAS